MRESKKHDAEFLSRKFDFSKAKRAKDVPRLARLQAEMSRGKTRITIMLDDDVLEAFRKAAGDGTPGYQTLINRALREYVSADRSVEQLEKLGYKSRGSPSPVDEATLRRVLDEKLAALYGED